MTAARLDEMPTGNDDLRPWLRGFVDTYGREASRALLEGVGTLEAKSL